MAKGNLVHQMKLKFDFTPIYIAIRLKLMLTFNTNVTLVCILYESRASWGVTDWN